MTKTNSNEDSVVPSGEFTPGPWEWRDVPSAGLQIRATLNIVPHGSAQGNYSFWRVPRVPASLMIDEKTNTVSALFSYEEWVQFPSQAFDEMQKANARLIAAAPDLYEACKKALTCASLNSDVRALINAALALAKPLVRKENQRD